MSYPIISSTMSANTVDLIDAETQRAREKHSFSLEKRDSWDRISNILGEEAGEVAEASMDFADCIESTGPCEEQQAHLLHELVQVASVAVRAIERLNG